MNVTILFSVIAVFVFAAVSWNMIFPIFSDRNIFLLYEVKNMLVNALPAQEVPHDASLKAPYDGTASCNCVVFRLDDVQDHFLRDAQIKVLDTFGERKQAVSLGVIAGSFGEDALIADKIHEWRRNGLIEISLHGLDHVDYSTLAKEKQYDSLKQANEKILNVFGSPSDIFIPPYNRFNNNTLDALNELNIRIISSSVDNDKHQYFLAKGENNWSNIVNSSSIQIPYHMPATIAFKEKITEGENVRYQRNSVEAILTNIDSSILMHGYAVVSIHPQDFAKIKEDGRYARDLEADEFRELGFLIDSVSAKGLKITTFSDIAGRK